MFPFIFPIGSLPDELGLFVPAALLVGIIAVLIAGRRDAAGGEDRVGARYVCAISLLTLFVALYAAFGAVSALIDLVVDHQDRAAALEKLSKQEYGPVPSYGAGGAVTSLGFDVQSYQYSKNNDANYDAAVATGLAALTAAAVFVYHRRRRMAMVGARGFAGSSGAVVNRTYLQGVKFVAALTVALAAAAALYGIWKICAPGIAGALDADVGRAEGVSSFLSSGLLAVAAALIFLRANNELER
jgi:hypothetical protein